MSSGKEATIGRSQQLSTYAIDDPTVSRNHLMIKFKSDGAIIRDLGSANGTSLDGVSIGKSEKMVKSGQIIKIGKVELFLFKKFR
jgi:pSer/pThr/pTyr-binding forkhead associated (FHA) protein